MGSLFHPKPEVKIDMVRHVVGLVRKVASKLGGFAGSTSTASDPTCDHLAGLDKIPPLVRGFVVRSGIGAYDCEVVIGGGQTVVCSTLAPVLNDLHGVSQACLPTPGSCVLVYVPAAGLSQHRVSRGVILGVLPDNDTHGVSPTGECVVQKLADTDFPEGGVAQYTESGPAAIASDTKYPYKGDFQCGRPHDLVPGEYALTNHAGAGLVIGALSTSIKGSEAACIRCSALDDQVRVTSGHFRHLNAAGSEEIFNDGGYLTIESGVSLYRPERLGVKAFGTSAFKWTPGDVLQLQEKSSGVNPLKPKQTAKRRLYRYAGYLGDVVNVFVANPDPNTDVESMDSDGKDQGLLHYHVDASGRFTMRSAAGILLERFDRIPIPKRKHYAWDPEGDKAEDTTPAEKKPFQIDTKKYPMGIAPALGDMAAWWNSRAYSRFVQFGKDFTVPQQQELDCPKDDYDEIGKGKESFQEYDTRHSYIGLTPDGGIVLRDAWGSEIVMSEGRITFNAAANIEVRSGSSVVILGGDDVVAKAYNSLDLSATKKDVRIKAENNLQMVSMKKGVLIQSKAESDGAPDWSQVGEDLNSTGVVIKADTSSVGILGKRTELIGTSGVNVAAFKEKEPSGSVTVAGKNISAVADGNVVATAKGTSGLIVGEQSAVLCAPTVLAVGGRSAAQAAGNKMLIGIPVDVENMYSQIISICKTYAQTYLESVDWLNPLPPTAFSEIDFRFRNTEQYGTDRPLGLVGTEFSVYEPSWAVMSLAGRTLLKACKTKAWDETPDAGDEYPWPGKTPMQGNGYVSYEEKNVDEKGLEKAETAQATLTPKAFSEYHIRER